MRVTEVRKAGWHITRRPEYGKLGEVTKETRTLKRHIPAYEDAKTAVMEYVSDYLGRMQRITYPDREVVTYGYDAGGQVCSITGDHDGQEYTYVADIGYDEYGQRVYIKYGNGVETNYTYDENMRWLSHIDTANTYGKQYQNIEYSFDDVGNVEKYTNDCMNGSRYRTEQTYTYDALYQLISATGTTEDNPYAIPGSPDYSSTYTQKFSFDAIGNMTQKKSEETITPAIQKKNGDDLNYEFTYQYDENYAHRLKRAGSEQKGWRYYTYDANGNVTSESDGVAPDEETTTLTPVTVTTQTNEEGESVYEADYAWAWPWSGSGTGGNKPVPNNKRRYEWNSRNLLMRSVNPVYDTRYVYAADGNRAAKWTATELNETLYFNTMWTWHTDTGVPDGQYSKHIYLGETRVVTKQTSKLEKSYEQSDEWRHRYYYHPDHLGSTQLITDYEGNEYQRIEYTPYGELWVEKKTEREEGLRYLPYKFTAKEQDEETGLYYYGARYLDAKYSRWLSADPAVSDYIPLAPVNDEARKHNEQLPGMGGIYSIVNLSLYHYAGNNPVKYTDPDGEKKKVPIILVGVQGTYAHNAAYSRVEARIKELGYSQVKSNQGMVTASGDRFSRKRSDFQGTENNKQAYWEMKQGADFDRGVKNAVKDINDYMHTAESAGVESKPGAALGVIAKEVPVKELEGVFIDLFSPQPGVVLYNAYRYEDTDPNDKKVMIAILGAIVAGAILLKAPPLAPLAGSAMKKLAEAAMVMP